MMIARLRRKTSSTSSSSIAIGTASAFVLVAACVSLLADRGATGPAQFGADWMLRGGLAPAESPVSPPGRHVEAASLTIPA